MGLCTSPVHNGAAGCRIKWLWAVTREGHVEERVSKVDQTDVQGRVPGFRDQPALSQQEHAWSSRRNGQMSVAGAESEREAAGDGSRSSGGTDAFVGTWALLPLEWEQ